MRRFSISSVIGLLALFVLSSGASQVMAASLCEGDIKIDSPGGGTIVAPAGQVVDSVCIKAGTGIFGFNCGDTDGTGCYNLEWTFAADGITCTQVKISGGGTGRTCRGISHVAGSFGDGPKCEPKAEVCDNGADDDCDGAVDKADADCQTK